MGGKTEKPTVWAWTGKHVGIPLSIRNRRIITMLQLYGQHNVNELLKKTGF